MLISFVNGLATLAGQAYGSRNYATVGYNVQAALLLSTAIGIFPNQFYLDLQQVNIVISRAGGVGISECRYVSHHHGAIHLHVRVSSSHSNMDASAGYRQTIYIQRDNRVYDQHRYYMGSRLQIRIHRQRMGADCHYIAHVCARCRLCDLQWSIQEDMERNLYSQGDALGQADAQARRPLANYGDRYFSLARTLGILAAAVVVRVFD